MQEKPMVTIPQHRVPGGLHGRLMNQPINPVPAGKVPPAAPPPSGGNKQEPRP